MKTTRFITSILLVGAIFTACDENKKSNLDATSQTNEREMTEMTEVTSVEDRDRMNTSNSMEKSQTTKRDYTMKDGSEISYEYDDRGVKTVSAWDDYNTLSYEMDEIEKVDINTKNIRMVSLDGIISNLGNSVPQWLKTEEVMEDVADIQKEYEEYKAEKNASLDERNENLEEISEQFADFREELRETIEKYFEIHRDAVEEFNEEMKDGDLEDAVEEYNEEIKEQDEIADYNEKMNK
ncbi:hypothetical protein [Winogradskyella ursingii]|uniref:hypothetical protein n=1 Tax=Winogradskyella ursingii TaxID=2686079 RepID=UPI0015CE96A1|nr:hypothetical protein [Winogradskyella ursingii]